MFPFLRNARSNLCCSLNTYVFIFFPDRVLKLKHQLEQVQGNLFIFFLEFLVFLLHKICELHISKLWAHFNRDKTAAFLEKFVFCWLVKILNFLLVNFVFLFILITWFGCSLLVLLLFQFSAVVCFIFSFCRI